MMVDDLFDERVAILLVDDDPLVLGSLRDTLIGEDYDVRTAGSGEEALQLLRKRAPDIIISDIKMPDMNGLELFRCVKKEQPGIPFILITGGGSIQDAVAAIKEGVYDYITKPIVDGQLEMMIKRLLVHRGVLEENGRLKNQLCALSRSRFLNMTGKHLMMQRIYSLIEAVARTRATVLINGESGTGKRLIAHAIHNYDPVERAKPFVEVCCGALTETLLESELFGHVKGSFSGAVKDRVGRFELADKGTIFLDEIDSFSPTMQVKLLGVLQEGLFERVGDSKTIKVDVRIIAASNQDLKALIAQGKFRHDLYYRLNVINIDVPPLRSRSSDIPLLIQDLMEKHSQRLGKSVHAIADSALEQLMAYHWPGNIRELENVIERSITLMKGTIILASDLPDLCSVKPLREVSSGNIPATAEVNLKESMQGSERDVILKALEKNAWNRNLAAKDLGINRTTLYKKMVRFRLFHDKEEQYEDSLV